MLEGLGPMTALPISPDFKSKRTQKLSVPVQGSQPPSASSLWPPLLFFFVLLPCDCQDHLFPHDSLAEEQAAQPWQPQVRQGGSEETFLSGRAPPCQPLQSPEF